MTQPLKTRIGGLIVLITTVGCDAPLGIGRAAVQGDWVYEASEIRSPDLRCRVSGATLSLDQDGSRFAGSVTGGTVTCTIAADSSTVSASISGAPITNGEIDGHAITFQIGAGSLRHAGRVEGHSMSGTVTLRSGLVGYDAPSAEGEFAASLIAGSDSLSSPSSLPSFQK